MKTAPTISFEFFPPKTAVGIGKLGASRDQLAAFNPKFFSVTFSAGSSTRNRTIETVIDIQQAGYEGAPHLPYMSSDKTEIRDFLEQ